MSEYLKGEKKEKVFDLIRKYMAYRMTDEEMVLNLKDKGHKISERNIRRFKQEIRKISGNNITEIYQNEIVDGALEDIFTMREIQRQCWQEYNKSKVTHEKLKALALIRNSLLDKVKLYEKIPWKFRRQKLPTKHDIEVQTTEVALQNQE